MKHLFKKNTLLPIAGFILLVVLCSALLLVDQHQNSPALAADPVVYRPAASQTEQGITCGDYIVLPASSDASSETGDTLKNMPYRRGSPKSWSDLAK